MVQGAQDNATGFVAFALETVSGTPEAAPQTGPNGYTILRGDMAPVSKKPPKFNEVSGQIFPTLPIAGGESFEMSLPMYPILAGNGLGPLLAALLGDDNYTALVADHVQQHILDWETLIKTFTTFCHYGTLDDDQYRMCAIDSLDISSKSSDNSLELDFKAQGVSMEKLTTGAVQTNLFIDPDSASQLTHSGLLLEIGQPGAAARDVCESLALNLKRNLVFGCLSKPGQHPAGSSSHNIVNSKNSNCELKLELIDTDREEILRAMYPVNTDPTTQSRFSDVMRYIKARMSWYGAMLYAGINGEADYVNAGTTVGTFAGTYSGGAVVTVGEIEMSDSDIYETALGTNKDLAFKMLDSGVTYAVETGSGLAVAVLSKAITVTLGSSGSTAAAILAALLATPAAVALLTPSLANGSTGAGTVTEAQTVISSTSFKDGFRYRYTTGGAWSAWTAWIKVTKSAQTIVSGITAAFDDDDITKVGDRFRFCSHYREMLRCTAPVLAYKDIPQTTFKDGHRLITLDLAHTSADAADRPFLTVINSEAIAFDTV
jgi:hypothetical protein